MHIKQIPNILTTIRILCSIALLACQPLSTAFIWIYIAAGASDMLDGIAARHLDAVSSFGERYDSLADFAFVVVCLIKLLPQFHLPLWGIIWIAIIAVIKVINLLLSYSFHRSKLSLHTIANKATGALLFLTPLALVWIQIVFVLPVVCSVSSFAAIQEGYFVMTGKWEDSI